MKASKFPFAFIPFCLTAILCSDAYADKCTIKLCNGLTLPLSVQHFILKGYSNVEVITLNGKEYLSLSSDGDVNKCSVLFDINKGRIDDIPAAGGNGRLCNVSELNDNIVSSRRDQGKWYNDVYQELPDKTWSLLFTDSCTDCEQVKRTHYKNGIKAGTELMSAGNNYSARKSLNGIISVKKASLFTGPDEQKKTRSYLIKGDMFTLVDMSDNGAFYQINYKLSSGKSSLYWVEADSFDLK